MKLQQTKKSIEVNNISISCNIIGEVVTPIIFIHGFPFDKSMWQSQLDYFSTISQAIAFDIRGFGESTSDVLKPASMEIYADDLIALMDALKIEKAIVCGFSMGGYILLNALHRFPNRFSAVIFADTQCIADSEKIKEKRYNTIKEIEKSGLHSFANTFVKNIFTPDTLLTNLKLVESITAVITSAKTDAVLDALKALANRSNMCSTLSSINIPALITCGQLDLITPIAQAEFLRNNIPNAILCIIEKAAHLSNLEQPDLFNKAIADFIKTV